MNKYKTVTNYNEVDIEDWNYFVTNHPNGNIFQTSYIFRAYELSKNYEPLILAVYDKDNLLVGIQVAVILKEYDNILGDLTKRAIIQGGPLVINNNQEILELLFFEYLKIIRKKAIYSQYRNMWDWGNLKSVFFKYKIIFEDHLDILFDLNKGEEGLLKEMKHTRRHGINKSIKKGIKVNPIDLSDKETLEKTYGILLNVYNRIKLPLPEISFFQNVVGELTDKVYALGAFIDNELIAIRIVLSYKGLVYDWYGGAKDEYLNLRPNDILPWDMIKWGISNNYNIFDFGGAGKPDIPYGVRDYKLQFGGNLVNFGRFEIVHKPFLMNIAKIGLQLKQKLNI